LLPIDILETPHHLASSVFNGKREATEGHGVHIDSNKFDLDLVATVAASK
jgi:hypothetical protein